MEVFMQHLPPDLTDETFKIQLKPHVEALGIKDWSCQKPRKKPFGFMSLLNEREGQKFLKRYGGPSRPLEIFFHRILCKKSNKVPDEFLLKSLKKTADDREDYEKNVSTVPEAKIVFPINSLSCGYYDYIHGELSYCPEVQWNAPHGFARFAKSATIIELETLGDKFRIHIPYRIVEALVVSTKPHTFTWTLWEAPKLLHIEGGTQLESFMASLSVHTLPQAPKMMQSRVSELSFGSAPHSEIVGQALVYQVEILPADFNIMYERLKKRDILTIYHSSVPVSLPYTRMSLREGMRSLNNTMNKWSQNNSIPFPLLFQMEALVRNGYLLPWIVQGLVERLGRACTRTSSNRPPISPSAIKKMFPQIPFPGVDTDASNFDVDELWDLVQTNERDIRNGHTNELLPENRTRNVTMIHRVNVTPTSISLLGPDEESKNRILRRFPNHTEHFIRAQFCDEDGTDLQFNAKVSNEIIYDRYKRVFRDGIAIGGRRFGFLGFSHSSLRSHSAWFMAPFVYEGTLQTYFTVISRLGTFKGIQSPARCAARIGQAFSETSMALSLDENGVTTFVDQDIKSMDGNRVFSDGFGTISQSVVDAIHDLLPRLRDGPTCFQIRWGGAKGMISLDPRLMGTRMHLRPSMIKFPSDDTENLEICDMARKPIPMVLNRQMIKILEDMGVSDDWFIHQQAEYLSKLQLVTAHVSNTVGFLKKLRVADHIGFPTLIQRLDRARIDYRRDHFLGGVVETSVLRELRLLKHKARIPISKGVTLFGIMDETGYLNEGEIYITFDKSPHVSDSYSTLHGRRMIVTRSPALHPGDIQLATNVIPPQNHPLRKLRNCIIFSQRGDRDLPSCLSGGDLDGDIYGIIWDQVAVRECVHIYEPADYPRVPPLDIGREVEKEDMSNFFIQFMATDQLGRIAIRHMILADQKAKGTDDEDCKLLAELHSTSVDYSKTGIPVEMSKFLSIKMNKYRPDFLMDAPGAVIKNRNELFFDAPANPYADPDADDEDSGPRYQYYYSEKINGILFRKVNEKKIWFEDIKRPVERIGNIWTEFLTHLKHVCDTNVGIIKWNGSIKEAWELRRVYEDAIWNATQEFSDHARRGITELEVFTGELFSKTGVQSRRQRDKSVKLKDEFDRIAHSIAGIMRKRNVEGAGKYDGLILSMACLDVGIRKPQNSTYLRTDPQDGDFQSFKVVAACCAMKELDAAMSPAQGRTTEDYVY